MSKQNMNDFSIVEMPASNLRKLWGGGEPGIATGNGTHTSGNSSSSYSFSYSSDCSEGGVVKEYYGQKTIDDTTPGSAGGGGSNG